MATTHLPRLVRPVSSMAEATMNKHPQQLDRTLGVHARAETPARVATVATP